MARPVTGEDANPIRVRTLLVDARTGDRAAIRRAADLAGAHVLDVGTDLAPVLYGTLVRHWRNDTAYPLAGLTSAASLFYLERVAFDWGLRTVYLGRHGGNGPDAHRIDGPECMVLGFAARARLEGWRSAAVSTSLRVPASARPLGISQEHLAPEMVSGGALFSWTLVPVASAAGTTTLEPRT